MNEIRCGACNRKLGEGQFTQLMIKCTRCGTMNNLRAERPQSERLERQNQRGNDHGHINSRPS